MPHLWPGVSSPGKTSLVFKIRAILYARESVLV